jgi:cyclopropane-fatty-acyl-phospholipid synthase
MSPLKETMQVVTIGRQGYNPLAIVSAFVSRSIAKSVDYFLARSIAVGSFSIIRTLPDGSEVKNVYGESREAAVAAKHPCSTIYLVDADSFFSRVASSADIGFAEAYISGDFTVTNADELVSIFRILILNRDNKGLSTRGLALSRVGAFINTALHSLNANSLAGSRRNIQAHYDLSNDLFATFLGTSWTYSCAYFNDGKASLDSAQYAKLDKVIAKARLSPDCHVVEIGCGWGEFAIRAAMHTGCRVTGITLSEEQCHLARKRVSAAGVSHLVSIKVVDYRTLPSAGVKYDRVVSIEMLEAVGHEFLGDFFSTLDIILKPDGVVVLQVITTPELRYEEYRSSADFIQKHIFPGGVCPSLEAVISAAAKCSSFSLEHAENIGPHYATTLKEWRRRFLLSNELGDVEAAGFDQPFVRKWVYYFCYCEAGFASRTLGTMQLVFSRPGNVNLLGGAPELRLQS